MKTAVVHLPASLVIEERDEPKIEPGMVKVKWQALSLNFHDYAVAAGMMPTLDGRIPISDGAGEIVEVGSGVTDWQVGDKVMSLFFPDWQAGHPTAEPTRRLCGDSTDGCAAEYSVVDPSMLTRIPRRYSYAEAATLPCAALTAWRALVEIGQIKPGDSVLVEGTGGVSIFALLTASAARFTPSRLTRKPAVWEREDSSPALPRMTVFRTAPSSMRAVATGAHCMVQDG